MEIDSYIVVLKTGMKVKSVSQHDFTIQRLETLADKHNAALLKSYTYALEGGLYKMSGAQAEKMALDPSVAYVEKDQVVKVGSVQNNATWGLDRLDQSALPLDGMFDSGTVDGSGVNAYIIDTGVNISHSEFQGRAESGYDFVDKDSDADDCNGHGTHVAGTIGGKTYGVAKNAKLHAVRVLNCEGSGTYGGVIEGIDWVAKNHVSPAVANMSLGGPVSQAVDDAIANAVKAGVVMVLAAGNENQNACKVSPARTPVAITVGATEKTDRRASYSNFGNCVDIFAPGSDITSAWYTSTTATKTISGTSMAAPHVAGVVALYLEAHPEATPAAVATALTEGALKDKVVSPGTGSPNLLANIDFIVGDDSGGGGGGGGEEPPALPVLESDVPVLVSGERAEMLYYSFKVTSGMSRAVVSLSGGTGDADLYVRNGAKPELNSYTCRPYRTGNNETCDMAVSSGTYYVMVRGYSRFNKVSLKASLK